MSFLHSLSRAFGLTSQEDVDDYTPSNDIPVTSVEEPMNQVQLSPQPKSNDTAVIFDGVVEFLNRELPPYLRQSLNIESQRNYLFQNLDKSLKEFLEKLQEEERKNSTKTTNKEKDRLKIQVEELKEKLSVTEEKLQKESEKALSSERQKRAINSRIKDLEEKIGSLEAEIEQYDLENKSLLNKLRVAAVTSQMHSNDSTQEKLDELTEKNQGLISENQKLTNENEGLVSENRELRNEIERLKSEISSATKENKTEAEQPNKKPIENDPAQMLLW